MKEEELITELYSAVNDKEKFNTILTENDISPEKALYISVVTRSNTEEESITVANSLLSQFTDLDINSQFSKREWTALHKACSDMRWPKMIKFLIDKKADVNITNIFKESPLTIAASSFAVDNKTLELIIKTSLHQERTQEKAKLALTATVKSYVSAVQEAHTALRNIPDHDYNSGDVELTPTHRYFSSKASFAEKLRSNIQLFLKNGLDVNARYDDGKTLLHIAIKHNDYELASFLTEYGIDKQIKDDNGQTAIDYTEDENYHNQKIIDLLRLKYGKKALASPEAENQSFTEENPQARDSTEQTLTPWQRIYAEYKGNAEVLKTKYWVKC